MDAIAFLSTVTSGYVGWAAAARVAADAGRRSRREASLVLVVTALFLLAPLAVLVTELGAERGIAGWLGVLSLTGMITLFVGAWLPHRQIAIAAAALGLAVGLFVGERLF